MTDRLGAVVPYYKQPAAVWEEIFRRLNIKNDRRKLLFRGASILTLDSEIGDFDFGDILINGRKIEAVGPCLSDCVTEDTVVIDAGGMIILPGIIDGHRHCWQNQFRRIIPDADLTEYVKTLHGDFAMQYTPHDMYVGNFLTMLTLLDAGVTTVADCAHNTRSRAHADATFKSYLDSGIRAVHVGAPSSTGEWEEHLPEDLKRLRQQYCSEDDSLCTVRMGIDMRRVMPIADLLAWARGNDFGIHLDGVMGQRSLEIVELGKAGLLGPDLTLIHCNDMPEEAWRMIRDSGTKVTLATTSEQQLGLGSGVPALQGALDHGLRPCLSGDVEVCLAGDMFTQMRTTVTTQRMMIYARRYAGEKGAPQLITHRDVLEFTTLRAAEAVGLGDRIGTLTPGKYADFIVIRAEDLNNMPLNNAVGTTVLATESRNVEMVFVNGQVRKWHGQLVGQDIDALREMVRASRGRIAHAIGFEICPCHNLNVHHKGNFDTINDLLATAV